MKAMLRILIFAAFFLGSFRSHAQKDNRIGAWTILNIQYSFHSKWGTWAELQSRMYQPFFNLFYYETKGGVFYNLDKNFQLLAGLGYYGTHAEDFSEGPVQKEIRIWQQVIFNQYFQRVKFEHRFRIEERFINKEFNNRFRYRINVGIPLNHKTFEPNTFFLAAFNEIFLTTKAPHFLRNRGYAGFGYQVNKVLALQLGWMYQYNYTVKGPNSKNNIAINCNIRLEDKSDFKERLPLVD